MERIQADVCVVGAGIVGLAHALEARARGQQVVVLERHDRAVGASVRNFGHVVISGMAAGDTLAVALRARERWLGAGRAAGLTVHECGTVIVARHEDELAVLAEVAAEPERGARMLTAAQVGELVPIPVAGVLGGLHGALDLRVDPRSAVAALAALLARDDACTVRFGVPVHEVDSGLVRGHGVEVSADAVIVCPGPDYDGLSPQLTLSRPGLTRCKLQMLRVAAPGGRRYPPALLTGLSLVHYPGFAQRAVADPLRVRLAAQVPELLGHGIHLIVTQLPTGDLILGDTHEYGDAVAPFGDEGLDELVLGQARALLGVDALAVRERWHGVYPVAPGEPFAIECPLPGVAVAAVVAGVGMSTALGMAPLTFDALARAATGAPA